MSGGGSSKKRRSKRTNSSGSGSDSESESESKSDYESESGKAKAINATKVSDLLQHGNNGSGSNGSKKSKRVLAIPAGIFLIKSATTAKQPSSASSATSFSSTYDDSRIRAMFDGNNDGNSDDDGTSDDDGNSDRIAKSKSAVISEDLYSKLFKMLAPNDADRKRYWVSAATTCRARNGIGKCTQESHHGIVPVVPTVPSVHAPLAAANKTTTRRNRRAKVD